MDKPTENNSTSQIVLTGTRRVTYTEPMMVSMGEYKSHLMSVLLGRLGFKGFISLSFPLHKTTVVPPRMTRVGRVVDPMKDLAHVKEVTDLRFSIQNKMVLEKTEDENGKLVLKAGEPKDFKTLEFKYKEKWYRARRHLSEEEVAFIDALKIVFCLLDGTKLPVESE